MQADGDVQGLGGLFPVGGFAGIAEGHRGPGQETQVLHGPGPSGTDRRKELVQVGQIVQLGGNRP